MYASSLYKIDYVDIDMTILRIYKFLAHGKINVWQ